MNMKTTKLLGIIAVLAVALAFIAVIPATDSDAAVATVEFEGDYKYSTDSSSALYVNVDNEAFGNALTFSNGTTSGNITSYVVSGKLAHQALAVSPYSVLGYGDVTTYTYVMSMHITYFGTSTAIASADEFTYKWTDASTAEYSGKTWSTSEKTRSGTTEEVICAAVSYADYFAGKTYLHVGMYDASATTVYELVFDCSNAYPVVTSKAEMDSALAGSFGTIYTSGYTDNTGSTISRNVKIVGTDSTNRVTISGTVSSTNSSAFNIGSGETSVLTSAYQVTFENVIIDAGAAKKAITITAKTDLILKNDSLKGWAGIYVMGPKTSSSGAEWADGRWGADGTTITATECSIISTAVNSATAVTTEWNDFGAVALMSQTDVTMRNCVITLDCPDNTTANNYALYAFYTGAYANNVSGNNAVTMKGNNCAIKLTDCAVSEGTNHDALDYTGLYYYGWSDGYNAVGLAADSNSVTVRNSDIGDLSGWTWSTTDSGSTWTYAAITPATFTVDGDEAETLPTDTIAITSDTSDAAVVIATGAVTTVTPAKGQTVILNNTSALTTVDVSAAGATVTGVLENLTNVGGLSVTAGDDHIVMATGMTGEFTFTKGSLVVNGIDMTGTITIDDGDIIKVSGSTDGATIFALAGTSAKIIIAENTTLDASDGSITIPAGATLTVYGTLMGSVVNNGEIILMTGGDISAAYVTGSGTITDKSDESDMEDIYVNGNTKTGTIDFPASQNVIVNGTWNLVSGAIVTIKGQLVVPEGAKLTVEAGAILIIDNDAKAFIEGTMVVEEEDSSEDAAELRIVFGTLEVEGTFNMNGILTVSYASNKEGTVNITAAGTATFGKASLVTVADGAELNVESAATLTIKGALDAKINNYGTIIIATEIAAEENSTIYMRSNMAAVDVQKFTIGNTEKTLTITDDGLVYYYDKSEKKYYAVGETSATSGYGDCTYNGTVTAPPVNTIVISANVDTAGYTAIVSGFTVVEMVASSTSDYNTYYVAASEKGYTSRMAIAGDVSVAKAYIGTGEAGTYAKNATLTLNGGQGFVVIAASEFTTQVDVTVINEGKFLVQGTADVSAHSSESMSIFTNNGTVSVSGLGVLKANAALAGTINACLINEIISSYTYYVYYGIDAAIALASVDPTVTEITVYGSNTVYVTATVVDGVTMTLVTGATVSVGIDASTILTVDDGAVIKGNGTIYVYGSLYAEDKTTVKGNTVISDVFSYETDEKGKAVRNGWGLWTNIVTALNSAEAGDTITISKDSGCVYVTGNVEIKEGVTLVVPEDSAPLYIYNGVTLTVNGILATELTIWAQNDFDITAKNIMTDRSSAIVVNGAILLSYAPNYAYTKNPALNVLTTTDNAQSFKVDGAPIAGAYYQTEDYYVISSPEFAIYALDDVITNITIKGDVSSEDLAFVATDDFSKIFVAPGIVGFDAPILTNFAFKNLYLSGVTLELTIGAQEIVANPTNTAGYPGAVNGIVTVNDSSLTLKDVYSKYGAALTAPTIADSNGKLVISNAFYMNKGSITVSAGTAYAGAGFATSYVTSGPVNISSGATLIADSGTAGTIAKMTVTGTLSVPNEKSLTISDLTIKGDVVVSASTSTKAAGVLTLTTIHMGITSSDYGTKAATSAAASLSGAFTVSGNLVAVISADSTVDETATAILAKYPYTTFYVEGSAWITVYAADGANKYINNNDTTTYGTYQYVPKDLENCEFVSWQYISSSGELKNVGKNTKIGASSTYNAVYACINYNLYVIEVYTDAGIKAVAIDGVEMLNDKTNKFITINSLKAGTHTVTYTIKDGYEEDDNGVHLYTMDGTILKDLKFTVDGDAGTTQLQLNGTEKYVPEPEPTPEPEKQSEWTVTTILLCVLVVLIAIMAVIVALRLNRN